MFTLRPITTRPKVHVRAKKDDFILPGEDPPNNKKVNPIKKWIMDVFKIKEIDYEKFRKESKWSIKPQSRPRE